MGFLDDVKEDQTLQIQVLCVAFFLLAFPSYFFYKAAATETPSGMGGLGFYEVTGELSYIDFDNGGEYIASGNTLTIPLNTDALSSEDQAMNIVGVLVTMSYGEDEETSGGITCNPLNNGQNAPDTITGTAIHAEFTNSADGDNGGSTSHTVATEWYNSSILEESIVIMEEADIISELDSNGAGLGDYTIDITVNAQAGDTGPVCSRTDNGEEVSYNIQLIVLDYSIVPWIDLSDL